MSDDTGASIVTDATRASAVALKGRLGFGSSALMSRVSRKRSLRLIGTALDAGMTHFDTARSYGFGEAEYVLGEGLRGYRDKVTLTTKLGILPPRRSIGLAAAKAMARGMLTVLPGARALLRRHAGSLVNAGQFDAAAMTNSLHTSLRALRTEQVDYLLLHEPDRAVLAGDEALEFLERMRAEGKIRHFGIAVPQALVPYTLSSARRYADVLQCPIDVLTQGIDPPRTTLSAPGKVFLHSALSRWLPPIQVWLAQDKKRAGACFEALQADLADPGTLLCFALQASMSISPEAHLLFTTTRPEHLRRNAAALKTAASAEQLAHFYRYLKLSLDAEEKARA